VLVKPHGEQVEEFEVPDTTTVLACSQIRSFVIFLVFSHIFVAVWFHRLRDLEMNWRQSLLNIRKSATL